MGWHGYRSPAAVHGNHLSLTVAALPMIALAAGFTMFAASNFWAACIDLAPGYSASLSALMNTVGSIGGVVSSTVTAAVAVHQGRSQALDIAVWVTLGSGLLFTLVNANRSITEREDAMSILTRVESGGLVSRSSRDVDPPMS